MSGYLHNTPSSLSLCLSPLTQEQIEGLAQWVQANGRLPSKDIEEGEEKEHWEVLSRLRHSRSRGRLNKERMRFLDDNVEGWWNGRKTGGDR